MRRPAQNERLPLIVVQIFGMVLVTAMAIYGVVTKSTEVVLACIAFAGGCVGISVHERARGEMRRAMEPPPEAETRETP